MDDKLIKKTLVILKQKLWTVFFFPLILSCGERYRYGSFGVLFKREHVTAERGSTRLSQRMWQHCEWPTAM